MGLKPKPQQWPLDRGDEVLRQVERLLGPYAKRIIATGSIRRRAQRIGDVDVQVEVREPVPLNIRRIRMVLRRSGRWIKGGDRMMVIENAFGSARLRLEVHLIHPPKNWYAMLALRTGPAEQTIEMVKQLKDRGHPRPHGELSVASEEQVFELAGMTWKRPEER